MTDRTERSKRDEAPEFLEANETRDELTTTPTAAAPQASDEQEARNTLALGEGEAAPARPTKTRRVSRKSAKPARAAKLSEAEVAAERAATEAAERANTVTELESQGFSFDEARRLIDISKRLEHSTEAQETRRLRFTRWLVEQGILNEFSA
jgi:hypothetical protein